MIANMNYGIDETPVHDGDPSWTISGTDYLTLGYQGLLAAQGEMIKPRWNGQRSLTGGLSIH